MRTAMIAITTKSSMSVKARRRNMALHLVGNRLGVSLAIRRCATAHTNMNRVGMECREHSLNGGDDQHQGQNQAPTDAPAKPS